MRALLFCLIGLVIAAPEVALAQMKLSTKPANPNEVRYFTSIDALMDGDADVILKETHQGKTVTSAVLDLCYPAAKGSDRRDRFVANLAVNGQTMTGTAQTMVDKLPVTVKLTRKPIGDDFEFTGQITIGRSVTQVASSDNSDLSEREFLSNQTVDDGITPAPKDFSEVSPESIGVRIKLDAAQEFLKSLKGQPIEIALGSLAVGCDALRAGEQTINMSVDPDRAASLIQTFKSAPGVVAAGWTSGIVDIERAIRFPAADWRDGDKLNRDKLAAAIAGVLSKTLAANATASAWDANTGKLTLTFKRPSQLFPALGLTEKVEISALVAPDRPGGSDRLMLWISTPVTSTADESAGAKLNLSDETSGDEEGEPKDDNGSVEALAKQFGAQRWDSDKSAWK